MRNDIRADDEALRRIDPRLGQIKVIQDSLDRISEALKCCEARLDAEPPCPDGKESLNHVLFRCTSEELDIFEEAFHSLVRDLTKQLTEEGKLPRVHQPEETDGCP